jgi:hypothetical protein
VPSDKGGYDAGLDVNPAGDFVAQFVFIDPADRELAVNGGGPRIMAWMVRLPYPCIILHPLHPCTSFDICQLGTVCRYQVIVRMLAYVMLRWHSHQIAAAASDCIFAASDLVQQSRGLPSAYGSATAACCTQPLWSILGICATIVCISLTG